MENVFADLIPGAAPKARTPTRADERRLQERSTQESINSSRLNQAATVEDLKKAPIDRARAAQALTIDTATTKAQIEKTNADAQKALLELQKAQQQRGFLDLKEQQAMAAARAVLMANGEQMYGEAVRKGYEPTSLRNMAASVLRGIPAVGDAAADWVRDPVAERARAGERSFTEGALRTVTGSAGPKEERPQTQVQYFPSSWQSRNPQLRNDLARLRAQQLATAKAVAGPALTATQPAAQLPPAAAAKLREGVVTTFGNGQKWTKRGGVPVRVP